MASKEKEENNKIIVPKAPQPKINIIPKKISNINLIEIDDDSDSSQNEKVSKSPKKKPKCFDDSYLSDDRYDDSFDEEFGSECETNIDSRKTKFAED